MLVYITLYQKKQKTAEIAVWTNRYNSLDIQTQINTEVNNRSTREKSEICFCYQLWTYFTHFSSVPIVDFVQENVRWHIHNLKELLFFEAGNIHNLRCAGNILDARWVSLTLTVVSLGLSRSFQFSSCHYWC